MQTANRRLGVVGDEDEILSDSPSVFRIITGKKTLPTVIPYVKKQESEEVGIARNKRPRVFLPTVRGGSSPSSSSDGTRHSNKRTKLLRLVECTIHNKHTSFSFTHIFSPSLRPVTLPPTSRSPGLMLTPTRPRLESSLTGGQDSQNRSRITPVGAHLKIRPNQVTGKMHIS